MMLSILTPLVPSRLEIVRRLCAEIESQIGSKPVEHLALLDNKRRTVGEKRDALLRCARGRYVAFVDDDDWISKDYVFEILKASVSAPDVITFEQEAVINGQSGIVEFGLGNPNETLVFGGRARRNAWHVCAWRRSMAIQSHFPAINYGEDWAFVEPLCQMAGLKSEHISKVLHHYRHDSKTTEAPPPR